MTAKTLRNKGPIDCTRGVSREQRAINRNRDHDPQRAIKRSSGRDPDSRRLKRILKNVRKAQMERVARANRIKNQRALDQERFGEKLNDSEVSTFEEQSFGDPVEHRKLSSIVVSLALFDGDKMLYACSGIPIPEGADRLRVARFVTSAHLVRAFNNYRNKDDKLRVEVRLPNNETTDGFLGLYDEDIAIVSCLGALGVEPIDLMNLKESFDSHVYLKAAGRSFKSGSLMAMDVSPCIGCNAWVPASSQYEYTAVLGGPLIAMDVGPIGLNFDFLNRGLGTVEYAFLPLELLRQRLQHFGILDDKQPDFREYSLPEGVSSIVPSGFMHVINRLRACGYPMPPPLVLEFNGELLNRFEDRFGEPLAWNGFPYGNPHSSFEEHAWHRLPKEIVKDLSRRVVSVASFNGYKRSFACTGLFIKLNLHGRKAMSTVILTSASLFRGHEGDAFDDTLKIEVFLPPNQRSSGTLEFIHSDYNIAIVSVNFNSVRAQDIFTQDIITGIGKIPSKEVAAIGRDPVFGLLMATIGEVKYRNRACKLDCKALRFSTCKIEKAGIGGPLINLDGSFVGMNFYDGSGLTPFLPRCKIVEALKKYLPLKRRFNHPVQKTSCGEGRKRNSWPVPQPYWFHGELDVDWFHIPELPGRTLN